MIHRYKTEKRSVDTPVAENIHRSWMGRHQDITVHNHAIVNVLYSFAVAVGMRSANIALRFMIFSFAFILVFFLSPNRSTFSSWEFAQGTDFVR